MKCDEFKRYGEVWLDNELEAGMAAQMERHRRECAGCARHLEQLRCINNSLAQALQQPSSEAFSWDAAELAVRQAFANQQRDSEPERTIPIMKSWFGKLLWPKLTEWRALASLWILAGTVQLLSQITDSPKPLPVFATTAAFSEFTVSHLERMEKILANSEADEPTPAAKPSAPPSQGALPSHSIGREV